MELTQHMLGRIEKLDSELGCYISIVEDQAMEQAAKVQKMLDKGILTSPLTGIPMGIKDNICTEGILTSCGSKMLSNFVPPYNAHVLKKLYNIGSVLLGKLKMYEYAMGSSTESSYFKRPETLGIRKGYLEDQVVVQRQRLLQGKPYIPWVQILGAP